MTMQDAIRKTLEDAGIVDETAHVPTDTEPVTLFDEWRKAKEDLEKALVEADKVIAEVHDIASVLGAYNTIRIMVDEHEKQARERRRQAARRAQ